jgi:arylsulfatase A-like enzyme
VETLDDVLPVSIPLLPEMMQIHGFKTIAVSAMGNISPFFGFGRGFDHFVELYKEETVMKKRQNVALKPFMWDKHFKVEGEGVPISTSEDINTFLFPLLEQNRTQDLFIFLWSMDTHSPYFHRDPQMMPFYPFQETWSPRDVEERHTEADRKRFRGLYEDMLYYNDHHLGLLIAKLRELDLFEETFFILTSDHGEAFGEHGFNAHAGEPYDEQIRVPLVTKFPKSEFVGKVSGFVQHIDIFPTLLEYAKISANAMDLQGKSFLPLLRDHRETNEFVFSELHITKMHPSFIALRTKDYKYMAVRPTNVTFWQWLKERKTRWPFSRVTHQPTHLFDLREDPGERVNIIDRERDVTRSFHERAQAIMKENGRICGLVRGNNGQAKSVDKEIAKQLQALGYLED